jgi:LPXTG-site transpeptidase (sortase) family protein
VWKKNMHDRSPMRQAGRSVVAQAFIWGGALLLLVGGFLLYPYAGSRLVVSSPTPTEVSTSSLSTTTSVPITHTPTLTPTLTSVLTFTTRPSLTPTPLPVIPDRIVVTAIDLDAPVVPVSWTMTVVDGQEQPMWNLPQERAAGWHETSASLGVPGNTVLNGHNTNNGEVFRDLYKLETGDTIILYSGKVVYTYAITQTLILPEAGQPLEVRIENARYIQPTEDERLTLVTCHPYGSLRNRLIVIARPIGRSVLPDEYLER